MWINFFSCYPKSFYREGLKEMRSISEKIIWDNNTFNIYPMEDIAGEVKHKYGFWSFSASLCPSVKAPLDTLVLLKLKKFSISVRMYYEKIENQSENVKQLISQSINQ